MTQFYGRLFGLGAGPGNPQWLTLQADRILKDAPVIALPRGVATGTGRSEKIVQAYFKPEKHVLRLVFPMTRDKEWLEQAWDDAAEQVLSYLTQGLDVAFVSEGDPSLYSTFSYLAEAVLSKSPHVAVEIVPGISSVSAASAQLGESLVMGEKSLAVVPGHDDLDRLTLALNSCDTVVILKISGNFHRIYDLLDSHHLLPYTVYLAQIGTSQQEIRTDWQALKQEILPYMSLLVVRQELHR